MIPDSTGVNSRLTISTTCKTAQTLLGHPLVTWWGRYAAPANQWSALHRGWVLCQWCITWINTAEGSLFSHNRNHTHLIRFQHEEFVESWPIESLELKDEGLNPTASRETHSLFNWQCLVAATFKMFSFVSCLMCASLFFPVNPKNWTTKDGLCP